MSENTPKLLARVPITVRWRDMDAMGHVNNAKYISFLEEARVRWMLGVEGVSMNDRIAPVATLNSQLMQVRDVPAGETVGYSQGYRAEAPIRVATCGTGYADGVMRSNSPRGWRCG